VNVVTRSISSLWHNDNTIGFLATYVETRETVSSIFSSLAGIALPIESIFSPWSPKDSWLGTFAMTYLSLF